MKTSLQVLGPGCAKCKMLAEHAERAATELGLDFELEKVTEIEKIFEFGVVATPALAVDGEIVVCGHVPSTPRLKEMLAGAGAVRA
jgi:small redox-active disulfide protein 2